MRRGWKKTAQSLSGRSSGLSLVGFFLVLFATLMLGQRTARAQCIPNDLVFGTGGPPATYSLHGTIERHTARRTQLGNPSGKMPCHGPHCREQPSHGESPPLPAPIPSASVKDLASGGETAADVGAPPSVERLAANGDVRAVARGRDIFHPPR